MFKNVVDLKVYMGPRRPPKNVIKKSKSYTVSLMVLSLLLNNFDYGTTSMVTEGVQELECTVNDNDLCVFADVVLTKDDYSFVPVADKENFTGVQFINSTVQVFGSDICEKFPFIKEIRMGEVGLETILPGALDDCQYLVVFQAHRNRIRNLNWDTFRSNRKLEMIYMPRNQIRTFDSRTFSGLKNLERFDFQSNLIEIFDPVWLKDSINLTSIAIYSNELTELNAEAIIDLFPKLEIILYDENLISCVRVAEINAAFREARIEYPALREVRPRYVEVRKIDDIDCLPDESWTAVRYRQESERKTRDGTTAIDEIDLLQNLKEDIIKEISQMLENL